MPGGTLSTIGNIQMLQAIQATITPAASVTAGASVTSTYTIAGLVVGDVIFPAFQAAITAPLSSDAIWVSASGVLSIQWTNASAGTSSASPTAILTVLLVCRPDRVAQGIASYPTVIA
jgi:hypothetical protein